MTALGVALLLGGSAAAQPYYTVQQLPAAPNGRFLPTGLNERGEVAGYATNDATRLSRAYVYAHGRLKDLGTLGGPDTHAAGINDVGDIVGTSTLGSAPRVHHAFVYSRGRMRDLGTLGGSESVAKDINNHGEVTGYSQVAGDAAWHAFIWFKGKMKDLGAMGGADSQAQAINDAGEVAGTFTFPDGHFHAFVYTGGKMIDLGTLPSGFRSHANAINAWGEVTGQSELNVNAADRMFLYSGGTMTDLGALGAGGVLSGGEGINRWSQIVGTSEFPVSSGRYRAVLFSGVLHDLNDLAVGADGWTMLFAFAINDRGQIIAHGSRGLEGLRGFLLTPISDSTYGWSVRRAK